MTEETKTSLLKDDGSETQAQESKELSQNKVADAARFETVQLITENVPMDPRMSMKEYPRVDNVFMKKGSLNYDLLRSKIYQERSKDGCTSFMEWTAYALVGIFTGLTACMMSHYEEFFVDIKRELTLTAINGEEDNMFPGWLIFTGFSMVFVLGAVLMTLFYGPGANGSGVAELIGYMNGVNYPGVFSFETFVTKTIGVVMAVIGGLCVGKEGPLAHIGANIGVAVLYLPLPKFEYFRNDTVKRCLLAAGTSAGVSAAFGAPVGGALFAYECSKPNTFWKFSVIWKVYFTCALAVITMAFLSSLQSGCGIVTVSGAVLKFGTKAETEPVWEILPSVIFVGVICGVLGGIFIQVNTQLGLFRKYYITTNVAKIFEALFFAFMTSSSFYWAPWYFSNCMAIPDSAKEYKEGWTGTCGEKTDLWVDDYNQYNCPDGYYSPMATLTMESEGGVIRQIIDGFEPPVGYGIVVNSKMMSIFLSLWFLFTISTYGVWVPAGLFLPGIIIGCAVGSLFETLRRDYFQIGELEYYQVGPILTGAGAMLSAYCRLTYSLVVIMLETTSSINLFIPMMLAVMIARAVGNIFTRSLYERALRMKQMPVLQNSPRKAQAGIQAWKFMKKEVVSLTTVSGMESIRKALETSHN